MIWILVILKLFAMAEGQEAPECLGTWTEWQNKNNPFETGVDTEEFGTVSDPLPCSFPTAIQVLTVDDENPSDLLVLNKDEIRVQCEDLVQHNIKCPDLKARFCCPYEKNPPPCAGTWTEWYNSRSPSKEAGAEVEKFDDISPRPCANPIGIHYLTVDDEDPTGEIIISAQKERLICWNDFQIPGKKCPDMKARFCCPFESNCDSAHHEWTRWISIDTPQDSTGDYELVTKLVEMDESSFCKDPTSIDAKVKSTEIPWARGGNTIEKLDPTIGLICRHDDQPPGICCKDYEVRFCCKMCGTECP